MSVDVEPAIEPASAAPVVTTPSKPAKGKPAKGKPARAAKLPAATPKGGKSGSKPVKQPVRPAKPAPKPKTATSKSQGSNGAVAQAPPAPVERRDLREPVARLTMAANDTRLNLLLMLDEGEKNVGQLAALLRQSQPAVSHHLSLLRHGRIVEPRRDGKHNIYVLTPAGRAIISAARKLL